MNPDTDKVRFLDLEPKYSQYESSGFVVLPIPYEGTVSYGKGTAKAPAAIIEASTQVELFDEELGGEFFQAGIFNAEAVDCSAASPEDVQRRTEQSSGRFLKDGKFVLALGGEHSISAGLVKAAVNNWPKLSVLHLDAHADMRDSYQQSKYSHACVMRQISELSVPTVSVGIRSYCLEESKLINPERTVSAREVAEARGGDRSATDEWINRVLDGLSDKVYVSGDIDVFDPSQAPGTGTPEPGGLDWYEVTRLLREVSQNRQIVSADIVEVIPKVAGEITEFLAARLAYKIIAYCQQGD
jgi:agmatinase